MSLAHREEALRRGEEAIERRRLLRAAPRLVFDVCHLSLSLSFFCLRRFFFSPKGETFYFRRRRRRRKLFDLASQKYRVCARTRRGSKTRARGGRLSQRRRRRRRRDLWRLACLFLSFFFVSSLWSAPNVF